MIRSTTVWDGSIRSIAFMLFYFLFDASPPGDTFLRGDVAVCLFGHFHAYDIIMRRIVKKLLRCFFAVR
jgi:hypothetical protein